MFKTHWLAGKNNLDVIVTNKAHIKVLYGF